MTGKFTHLIDQTPVLLRPGTTRRFSFRGTPGGLLSMRVITHRGPLIQDPEDPVEGFRPVIEVGEFLLSADRTTNSPPPTRSPAGRSALRSRLLEAVFAQPLTTANDSSADSTTAVFLTRPVVRRPNLSIDNGGGLVIVDPDFPGTDIPPVSETSPEIMVRAAVRGGNLLKEETLKAPRNKAATFSAGPFAGHDVIDVSFTNENDFPVVIVFFLDVTDEYEITSTTVTRAMLDRVFRDTLFFFTPEIKITDGKMIISFSREIEDNFGIGDTEIDLGFDVDATLNFEPVRHTLLSHEQLITSLALEMEIFAKSVKFVPKPNAHGQTMPAPTVPTNFVTSVVETYFAGVVTLSDLFAETMELHPNQWRSALESRPILKNKKDWHRRDAAAMHFRITLKEIQANVSVLQLNANTIVMDLFVVLESGSTLVSYNSLFKHQTQKLPHDSVPIGLIVPVYHLKIDVSNIDAEVDFGVDNILVRPFVWLGEQVTEVIAQELIDWFKGDGISAAITAALDFLEDVQFDTGRMMTEVMGQIANRNHQFRHLRMVGIHWVIETLDHLQLSVPVLPVDTIDHRFDDIDINLDPVEPIDGPMPANASDKLQQVEHLVFVMMENRSFDHMLGYLSHPNHGKRNDVDGLNGRTISLGGDFTGTKATPQSNVEFKFSPSPGHSVNTVAAQIADGKMDGFVSEFAQALEHAGEINPFGNLNDPERILGFHTGDELEYYDKLAKEHLILDRWFCSFPGGTYPNRMCYYTGFSNALSNHEIGEDAGYHADLTIFDLLDRQNIDWTLFESDISFLRMFEKYRLENAKIRGISELLKKPQNFNLPQVTFIDPNFRGAPSIEDANDDHPSANIENGQKFIKNVVESLKNSVNWDKTMLVIMYDEHGGFADHVPPPGTALSFPPDAEGNPTVPLAHPEVNSYGPRVPAIVVSPLIDAGEVGHQIYDHATVFKTILQRFMPELSNSSIIPERIRRARHLGELVTSSLNPNIGRVANLVADAGIASIGDESNTPAPRNNLGGFTADFFTTSAATTFPQTAVVLNNNNALRPHLAVTQDPDDFHFQLARIGTPWAARIPNNRKDLQKSSVRRTISSASTIASPSNPVTET